MTRPVWNPLKQGSKREGITDEDAPPVTVGLSGGWQEEVAPHPVDEEDDDGSGE